MGQDHFDRTWCVRNSLYDAPIPIPRHKLVFRALTRGKRVFEYTRAHPTYVSIHRHAYFQDQTEVARRRRPCCCYHWLDFSLSLSSKSTLREVEYPPFRRKILWGNVTIHVKTTRTSIFGFIQNSCSFQRDFLDWTFSGLFKVSILQSLDEGFLEPPRFLDKWFFNYKLLELFRFLFLLTRFVHWAFLELFEITI